MKLYLLRHGVAADRDPRRYPNDHARPLTSEGKEKMRLIARALAAMRVACDALVTSPLPRAVQTAEIVAPALGLNQRLTLAEELAPEGDPEALIERLAREYGTAASIVLVGHEPYLSQLIWVLLTGQEQGVGLALKKGGLCRLDIEALRYGQCAVLESLLTPKQMIRLAGGGD
jgi:phosphohistidine phosphatase